MTPRRLRHCLEKSAKLLVLIQKHTPEAECIVHEDKGENGHLIVDLRNGAPDQKQLLSLGKELEKKGFAFTKKNSPWLGLITYTGKDSDKPTVILTTPIAKDRLAINDDTPAQAYSFDN